MYMHICLYGLLSLKCVHSLCTCVYACVYICMFVCVESLKIVHFCTHVYACMHIYMFVCILRVISVFIFCTHMCMHAHKCIYVCMCTESLECVHSLYTYVYACIYICTCLYVLLKVLSVFILCTHVCMYACTYAYVCMCMSLYMCTLVCMPEEARSGHQIPWGMELQVVVSHLTWALGTKLTSNRRAATLLATVPSFGLKLFFI